MTVKEKAEIVSDIDKLINKYGKEELNNNKVIKDLINLKNQVNVINSKNKPAK